LKWRALVWNVGGAVVAAVLLTAGCSHSLSPSEADRKSSRPPDAESPGASRPQARGPAPSVTPRGSVPQTLVGEWNRDGTAGRFAKMRFRPEGSVALTLVGGRVIAGTAVVEGTSMTLHVAGGPISYKRWSIEKFELDDYAFENLILDGVRYVRDVSGS
jgi:hypothetical protein